MWTPSRDSKNYCPATARGFRTPPPPRGVPHFTPAKKIPPSTDPFHVIHKVPSGDSPYVKAKHVQLIDKDPSKAISLFWAAINSGDRVDSALKDMAIVMKQLDRSDEAIEAIKSFRHLCPHESQEPLDNILLELYKRSGRFEDQIKMLELKVKSIEEGMNFSGKRIKPARSQGKKFYMTIEQEYSRLLGNLAWAHMQNNNFKSAEEHYRKALSLEPDKNKQCNLAICLMHMKRLTEAKLLLQRIKAPPLYDNGVIIEDDSYVRSYERATQLLFELESNSIDGQKEDTNNNNKKNLSFKRSTTPEMLYTQPRRCSSGSINSGDWKRLFLGNDNRCARKLAFEPQSPALIRNNNGWSSNMGGFRKSESGWKSKSFEENSVKNEKNVGEDYSSTPMMKSNKNKSWADMVEEEEEQAQQTQPRDRFNNENTNNNLMMITPINETKKLSQNPNIVSSLLNFVENERVDEFCYDCGNGVRLLTRSSSKSKRLQVFRDITH